MPRSKEYKDKERKITTLVARTEAKLFELEDLWLKSNKSDVSVCQEFISVLFEYAKSFASKRARKMEAKMPNAALVVLEGTDHFSFLYKPVEFRNILRSFLGIGGAA